METTPAETRPRPPTKPGRPRTQSRSVQLSGLQVMFAVVLAVGLLLTINFSSRIAAARPLLEAYELVKEEITILETQQAELLAEKEYSRDSHYVEQWARGRGKMIKPGDKLFVPVPSSSTVISTPVPIEIGEFDSGTDQPENWELWWGLFFDGSPPALDP